MLVLVAGCADAPEIPDSAEIPSSSASGSPAPVILATYETQPLSFEGNLGTAGHACVFPAGTCHTQSITPGASDLFLERPGVNLTALSFNVTWQAQTAATQSLVVRAMVMASCEGCNTTRFMELEGTSPLRIDIRDVDVALTPDYRVHISVYNPKGLVYNPSVPGYAFVAVDQAFKVEGNATFLVPAT